MTRGNNIMMTMGSDFQYEDDRVFRKKIWGLLVVARFDDFSILSLDASCWYEWKRLNWSCYLRGYCLSPTSIRRMPPPGITTWITWCGTWMPMVVWRSSTPHLYATLRPSERKARWNGPSRPPGTKWGAIRGPKCWMFWGCWEVASCWQFKALQQLGWRNHIEPGPLRTRSQEFPIAATQIHSFVPFLMSLALDLHFHRRMTFFPMLMVHTSCLACTIGILTFFTKKTPAKTLRFWTGYFTSRPALKRYIRDTSAFFQAETGVFFGYPKLKLTANAPEK